MDEKGKTCLRKISGNSFLQSTASSLKLGFTTRLFVFLVLLPHPVLLFWLSSSLSLDFVVLESISSYSFLLKIIFSASWIKKLGVLYISANLGHQNLYTRGSSLWLLEPLEFLFQETCNCRYKGLHLKRTERKRKQKRSRYVLKSCLKLQPLLFELTTVLSR